MNGGKSNHETKGKQSKRRIVFHLFFSWSWIQNSCGTEKCQTKSSLVKMPRNIYKVNKKRRRKNMVIN